MLFLCFARSVRFPFEHIHPLSNKFAGKSLECKQYLGRKKPPSTRRRFVIKWQRSPVGARRMNAFFVITDSQAKTLALATKCVGTMVTEMID